MIAYLSFLVLFFFTITTGQVTSWTGNGGSGNNTVSNSNNWSNGVPTATSIVYINETTCNGCIVMVDIDLIVAELHLSAVTGTGPYFTIVGVNVTVTANFTIGYPSTTSTYETYVDLQAGGIFEIAAGCVATIYYQYDDPIQSTIAGDTNWFNNKGTIVILDNGGSATGVPLDFGPGSDYPLIINSWGTWDVSQTTQTYLRFYFLGGFNIYGGSFKGGWIASGSTATIVWYGSDVVFQNGAGGDSTGAGAVSFTGYVLFQSYYTQSGTDYSSSPINVVAFNCSGVTVANAELNGVNVVFYYDGWLSGVNVTNYGFINSSTTGVHAYFVGNSIVSNAVFAGLGTNFIVQVQFGATVTMLNEFAIYGTITVINNGTWIYNSNSDLYFDAVAYWVNLGVFSVINYANDWIRGSSFPGLTTPTSAGTIVNMGTITFSAGGGFYFYDATGTFLQCSNGIIKLNFTLTTQPGQLRLAACEIDGYIGAAFSSDYSETALPVTVLTSIPSDPTALPSGDVSFSGSGLSLLDLTVCYSETGSVTFYKRSDQPLCPTDEYQNLVPITGGACGSLPANILMLEDLASCPADANCGFDTGTISGPSPSAAHVNAASLAFFVSLICLLLKF
jgi:fermentation-respiration switch protein FrsA (DUF1100 family)